MSEFHKRVLSLLLVFVMAIPHTGCGSLISETGPEPIKEAGSIKPVQVNKGKVKRRDKKEIDYSTDRFSIGGINAFYILPGLENIPDAMADFKVLDYNALGEFVYYYVTPCYMKPEDLDVYKDPSKRTGVVKDRSQVTVPEGRTENYDYDAAVLMTYNPGKGTYRVLFAKAFKIDKEREFDPATEGRPYYYLAKDAVYAAAAGGDPEDDKGPVMIPYRTFIQQRILCCKVAGHDEYLIMDQGSLTGVVYDAEGNQVRKISYLGTLDNEIAQKKDDLFELREEAEDEDDDNKEKLSDEEFKALEEQGNEEQEEPVDPDLMNVLITDVVMTERYESYLGLSFFLGGDLFKAMPAVINSTCLVYRQNLNEEEGGSPFLSVNLNSDAQNRKWMSLDKRFFKSYDELENADGYSMEGIKNGKYGEEYQDSFSPFINGEKASEASFLVGMPYFYEIPGSVIDQDYAENLYDVYSTAIGEGGSLIRNAYAFEWVCSGRGDGGSTRDEWKKIVWGADNEPPAKRILEEGDYGYLIKDGLTIGEKRTIQAIAVNTLSNKMHEELTGDLTIERAMAYFNGIHYLPMPGPFIKGVSANMLPSGFFSKSIKYSLPGGANEVSGETFKGFVLDSTDDPGLCYRSDHIVSLVSVNGVSRAFMYPVDYFPESAEKEENWLRSTESSEDNFTKVDGTPGVRMEPYEMSPSMNRTVYVYDKKTADSQIREMKISANLSEEASKAVDELSLLMRTSPDLWEKVKLGWFISQVTGDMDSILNTVSQDAAKANDQGRLSDDQYKKAMELLDKIKNDIEQRTAYEIFRRAREDAKKEYDDGKISEDEYNEIIKTLDKAEQEKLGLNDEDWEMFEKLISASRLISDAQQALVSSNGIGKKDMLSRINDLSKKIPEDIREGMMYLCAGFRILMQQAETCPVAYKAVFPYGASIYVGNGVGHETTGGRIDTHRDGIIVSSESTGEWFGGNTFMIGYKDVNDMDLFDRYTYGAPIDLSSMEYNDGDNVRSIIVLLTDKGAKFLERNEAGETSHEYDDDDLEDMIGEYNTKLLYNSSGMTGHATNPSDLYDEQRGDYDDITIRNVYTPLPFDQRGNEAYESVKAENELQEEVNEDDFRGFLTNEMLVTSTGYTRDTENLMDEAISAGVARATAGENNTGNETGEDLVDTSGRDKNDRYIGRLNSAKNICMIALDKALICSVTGGTKILDLNHGTIADDMEGSFYRAYQRGSSDVFSVIGFNSTDFSYLDVDLPMAKIYTLDYSDGGLDKAVVESFMNMLDQYAKDYLYREYRTVLSESSEIELKEATEAEKQESVEAGAIFDPDNTSYETALAELEKKYGIERTPTEIRQYTDTIRGRIAAVRPAITRIYELAGAKKLAADTAKRSEGYWRNVESRMTMAKNIDLLGDILVEIRMHDDVLPTLPKEQADKYRSYKSVIDFTKEHTKVSANDIFAEGSLSMNNADAVQKRLAVTYRNDVLKDIINEYSSLIGKKNVSGNTAEMTEQEKRDAFDQYMSILLDQVNPENFALDKDKAADEFVDVINHGKVKLAGQDLEDMRSRIKEELPSVDATWKLEELVLREKIENGGAYSEFKQWLREYDERINAGSNDAARLKIPIKTGESGAEIPKTPLAGNDRISFLRTSAAYRAIIGDLKSDDAVKEFLAAHKETWDDYCKEVVQTAGMRVAKDRMADADEGADTGTPSANGTGAAQKTQ